MLFVEQKDFVWGLIASMYLGNVVGLIVVLTCVPLFAAILRIPFSIIAPIILVICAVGAYTVHNSMFDVWMMMAFGVVGYVFQKLGYPLPPPGAGHRAGRQGRGILPPGHARQPGQPDHLLFQLAGRHDHDARPDPAAVAADHLGPAEGQDPLGRRAGAGLGGCSRQSRSQSLSRQA
jgi:hypothetical protein